MRFESPDSATRRGGIPWGPAVLVAILGWWTIALGSGASTWCFLDLVNLAFHEAGHLFLGFAGKTVHYLGGTIGQLAVPAGLVGYFLVKNRQTFAAAVCAWWVGENLVNISIYMADARALSLPLVGGGDHDWNELFYRFGLLAEPSVRRISTATHVAGAAVMLLGLAWAGCFVLPASARDRVRARVAAGRPWLADLL